MVLPLESDSLLARLIGWWRQRVSRPLTPDHRYSARLPSSLDGAYFDAVITVTGSPAPGNPTTSARVHESLIEKASEVSRRYSALDAPEPSSAVSVALSDMRQTKDLTSVLASTLS